MRESEDCSRDAALVNVPWIPGNLTLCVFLLFGLSGCRKVPNLQQPSPPDLSGCTRITIEYLPSTLEYFFPGKDSH
ncbi:MAG: hypothetical protein ACYS0H_10345, partial [Planctomycetota bacterium]